MAADDYLAIRAEDDEFHQTEAVERRHIESVPDGDRDEVREILRRLGIVGDLLERVVAAVTAGRDRRVRMMLREEYGLPCARRGGRLDRPVQPFCFAVWSRLYPF